MRIGQGYGAHRLVEGRELILDGTIVSYEKGFPEHSDADVLIRAVMDVLLEAAVLGDTGQHFPSTDPAYKRIPSIKLLKHAGRLLEEKGYVVGGIDATVTAQRPKLAPYHPQMAENIVAALDLSAGKVSMKAITEKRLGSAGSGGGIPSQAIILLTAVEDYCHDEKIIKSGCGSCQGYCQSR